jgi:hypothetical protein
MSLIQRFKEGAGGSRPNVVRHALQRAEIDCVDDDAFDVTVLELDTSWDLGWRKRKGGEVVTHQLNISPETAQQLVHNGLPKERVEGKIVI